MFRRKDKSPSDGFYEAFSDIIFATMAIFVLLMTIFLVVVRVSDVPQQAEPQIQSQGADDIAACVAQRFVIEEQQREREANALHLCISCIVPGPHPNLWGHAVDPVTVGALQLR